LTSSNVILSSPSCGTGCLIDHLNSSQRKACVGTDLCFHDKAMKCLAGNKYLVPERVFVQTMLCRQQNCIKIKIVTGGEVAQPCVNSHWFQ